MIGIEAVVLEEASPCSMSGSMVVGTGGYLTENLEMSADCRQVAKQNAWTEGANKQYGRSVQAKFPSGYGSLD